jgi:membrane-bound serine protease (ClpP class)
MGKKTIIWIGPFALALILFQFLYWAPSGLSSEGEVMIIDLVGAISPGSAAFLKKGIEEAEERDIHLVIIRLDTPGGLGSSMRTMVKSILNSSVPVVVYVAPKGAGAASAGVMITVAGHVAAMAPGTNIGAASPVSVGGGEIQGTMSTKVMNDMASYGRGIAKDKGRNAEWVEKAIREAVSITAREAVKMKVVDLVAEDLEELLEVLDGREVALKDGKKILKTKGLTQSFFKPGFRDGILKMISDPNISFILLIIGAAGLYFEFSNPGAIFPGVIGAISLIMAFYSFQALPVNYTGLILIALAIIFFIAEVKVTSYGVLSMGGVVSLALGSLMLFEDVKVSLKLMAPTIVLISAFFIIVSSLAFRAHKTKPKSGMEGMIGSAGLVKETIDPEGLIFIHGEYWRAVSGEKMEPGERVQVENAEGLVLTVKRANDKES